LKSGAPKEKITMTTSTMDALDFGIVRELQDDGRRAFREIARNLSVPEATVRTRVKRLQDQGVLQILAFTDPSKWGQSKLALFFVDIAPDDHAQVVETLEKWSEVSYLSTTTGSADLCVQVLCRDDQGLWAVQQRVRSLPGVRAVRVLQEIKVHKIRFTLPPTDPES
jgi:Lrp/AsnC family transcriptional regulator, regulator for asnA, asnC and gidA